MASKLSVKQARCIARDQVCTRSLTTRTERRLDLFARFLAFLAAFFDCSSMVVVVEVKVQSNGASGETKHEEHGYVHNTML